MASEMQISPVALPNSDLNRHAHLLYHFCRLQLPVVTLPPARCEQHLQRTFAVYCAKLEDGVEASWSQYLENLHPLDWYVASACLEGNSRAWEYLFAARAGRSDCLLIDALRARAAACIRAMRNARIAPSPNFGAIYMCPRGPIVCPYWPASMVSAPWSPG